MSDLNQNTDFLYPFIEGSEDDPGSLLLDLAASARGKAEVSARLQEDSLAEYEPQLQLAGGEMADRFARGGRLYTFGNGGSSTDAATLATLFSKPALGRAVPAWSLAADQAVVTALGNDVGFELIFSRQVIAHSKPVDIAIALSTSGNSDDLIMALTEAKKRGLLTIGFAGHSGGSMSTSTDVDYCFTIHSQSIHRIQESHARVGYRLWSIVQEETRRRVADLMAAAPSHSGGAS